VRAVFRFPEEVPQLAAVARVYMAQALSGMVK
jgi:hypothetical protein